MNKEIRIIAISIVLLLNISLVGVAAAEKNELGVDTTEYKISNKQHENIIIQENHASKKIQLSLSENVGISSDNDPNSNSKIQNNDQNSVDNRYPLYTEVNLFDTISISDNPKGQNVLLVISNLSPQTTLDKISNTERIRFHGKTITITNENLDQLINIQHVLKNTKQFIEQMDYSIIQIIGKSNIKTFDQINTQLQHTTTRFYTITSDIAKDVGLASHDLSSSTPVILVLMVPLSGYILLRSEEEKIKLNKNQIFSFCFILILVSSSAVTPFAISQNYWGMAFAEPQNQTSVVNNTISNGTTVNAESLTVSSNETNSTVSLYNATNYNLPIPVSNSTVSNHTSLVIPEHQTNSTVPTNQTESNQTEPVPNYLTYGLSTDASITDSLTMLRNGTIPPVQASSSLSTGVSIADGITILRNGIIPPVNATSSLSTNLSIADSINVTKSGITIPRADKSWNFTTSNDTIGKARVENNTLNLKGNGYLQEKVNSTNTLDNFTVSAWVKPDYSQGSPVFSVITKSGLFALDVNNNISPSKAATFSIYDGIHWSTINSTVQIPENSWTYLAGTYNGTYITIYVNGTLQSSYKLQGVLSISDDGHLVPVDSDQISSNADVVIGASVNTIHAAVTDKFSGGIQKVNLYKTMLTPEQVSLAYQQDVGAFTLQNQKPKLSVNATLTTNSTVTTPDSNATSVSNFSLNHDSIVINKPVTWTQNIVLSNKTDGMALELPADAKILSINSTNGDNVTTIFTTKNALMANVSPQSGQNVGISNNGDIGNSMSTKLSFLDNSTSQTPIIQENTTVVDNKTIPMASLNAVSSMVEYNKPTKVLVINNTGEQYNVKFETPAPYTEERNHSTASLYQKNILVANNSTLHYTDVKSFTAIPENLVAKGVHFKLYWMINGSKVDVTSNPGFNVEFVDTNGNGIPDQMQWTVPHLSEQQFVVEAQLTVINVQSYPVVGGNWTVYFNTTGTADLTITAINGTLFGDSQPADLQFLKLSNGTTTLTPILQNNSIIYRNYSSTGIGFESSHVMTSGKHHLMFQFGNSVAFANNNAFISQISVNVPLSVVIDSSGNFVYGAATDNVAKTNTVPSLVFNSSSTASFGVAVNNTGHIFVADAQDDKINIFDSNGNSVGSFGSTGSGNTQFSSPTGVAVDSSGNIYVADTGNDRVQKFDAHRNYLATFGSSGSSNGQFLGPMGVAINSTSYVYITDAGNDRVEIFAPNTSFVSSFGATGSGNGQFNSPIGIAVDGLNNVYVTDIQNDRIEKFSPSGSYLSTFGSTGSGNGNFDGPIGVAIDSSNSIYVADANNNKIKKFYPDDLGPTDTQSISESIKKSITKSLSDNVSITDSMSTSGNKTKSLSDSVSIIDTIIASGNKTKSLSDNISITDSMSTSGNKTKSLSDNISITDSIAKSSTIHLSLSDSVSITDSIAKSSTIHLSLSDSVSITDTELHSFEPSRSFFDSVSITDTIATSANKTKSLSDSVSISETTSTATSQHLSLSDSISITDTIATSATKTQSLSDSISITDTIATSATKTQSLSDSISITDTIATSANKVQSLSDSVSITDTTSTATSQHKSLSDNVSITDTIATSATKTQSLSDSVSISDTISASSVKSLSLSDNVSITDVSSTATSQHKSLSDNVSITDTTSTATSQHLSLSDSISITDTIATSANKVQSLSDSVSITDTISTAKVIIKSLSDSVSISETTSTATSQHKSLSDSVSTLDQITTSSSITKSLSDNVSITDVSSTATSQHKSLSDNVSITDTISTAKVITKSLSDNVSITDVSSTATSQHKSLSDNVSITDVSSTATSQHKSLSDNVSITDTIATSANKVQSLSDNILISDSLVTARFKLQSLSDNISITDTTSATATLHKSLSDSVSLADSLTTHATHSFIQSLTDSVTITTSTANNISHFLSDNVILSASSTPFANLASNQQVVENATTQITVSSSTPQLVVVNNNTSLANITVPSTVTSPTINYSAIKQTSGSVISVPVITSLTITKDTTGNTQPDIKLTIPSNTTISGTSWNAVLTLPTVQSSSSVSLPTTSGEVNTPKTVITIGSTTSLSFDKPVRLLFVGQAGLRTGFFHSTSVTEITSVCTSDSVSGVPSGSNECKINVGADLVVWTKHFTGFATWSSSSSSTSGSSSTSSQGGGTGTGVGVGVGTSTSTSTSNGGGAGPYLKIQKVSYDTCDKQIVRIQIATDKEVDPMVVVRTSITGVVDAKLVADQPYAQENINATIKTLVYEASINPKETSFEVLALGAVGHNVFSVGKTITVSSCSETISFENLVVPTQVDVQAPQIFDVKYKIENHTSISADTNGFVDSKPVTINAIINSNSTLDQADLRFSTLNANTTLDVNSMTYDVINMQVTHLSITGNFYMVTATISPAQLQSPALVYWIHVKNSGQKTSDSQQYILGIKPTYTVNDDLDIDIQTNRAEGTTATPTAYVTNNAQGPLFGTVSLLVNGKPVYTSVPQIFETGQTAVKLEWHTPVLHQVVSYQVTASAEIYGKSIKTNVHTVNTFPSTKTIAISNNDSIDIITSGNTTIAYPSVLYSSFTNDHTMRYKVTSPDGTCVIGMDDNCMVHDSTLQSQGGLQTVTLGGQVYRIRYSGPDSALERFSITSVDPITGNWKIEIVSQHGMAPVMDAESSTFLKIQYRPITNQFITEK